MLIVPDFCSVSNLIETSPIGVIAMYFPLSLVIFLTNYVLHFGRFSMLERNSKTLALGDDMTRGSVTEFIVFHPYMVYS